MTYGSLVVESLKVGTHLKDLRIEAREISIGSVRGTSARAAGRLDGHRVQRGGGARGGGRRGDIGGLGPARLVRGSAVRRRTDVRGVPGAGLALCAGRPYGPGRGPGGGLDLRGAGTPARLVGVTTLREPGAGAPSVAGAPAPPGTYVRERVRSTSAARTNATRWPNWIS